ncbi:MAG TPA: sn-glycerol-3-phosphate ABC transporter ATP-binding protein UgpC [Opitutaceae bacterium]|nr:sn-glycerol-3-phosphate ABC transporter ATP-binding protein UgpC [Opitutaceae bacterium]
MARVVLEQLTKLYPDKTGPGVCAVAQIDLVVNDGEFVVLVGPSGCGKSTTLRMIAGLEEISGGTVAIDGKVVNDVPPKDRDIAMVFQNYALYPHMSVYENMAFGLKLRKFPKSEIDARVREAAALLGLETLLDRRPKALSGGQRQRVAVGRAIVRKPKVFLFDEPLSNLDAKMRVATRAEISRLHAKLGATMIYVTHDQVEAMTMGDRICVMKDGRIAQTAEPLTLYNQPANLFVAGFIGSPPMNFLRGVVRRDGDRLLFAGTEPDAGTLMLTLPEPLARSAASHLDRPVVLGIRPEHLRAAESGADAADNTARLTIRIVEPMGAETYLHLDAGTTSCIARVQPSARFKVGQQIRVALDLDHAHLFDAKTEQVLGHSASS